MRIATSTITSMATGSMTGAYNKYSDIINKISSGKNFTKVSENPVDATRVLKLEEQLSKLNLYQSNIEAATNEMNLAYDTLGDIQDEVTAINSLVVEAASATTTPDSAKAIAVEIKQRVATIMDKMNTKYMDNYIFSGTYTETKPYSEDVDGNIVYQGSPSDGGKRNLTISEDTTFAYNVVGEDIMGSDDVNNFFSQMSELDELLNADTLDYDAIREKLKALDDTTKNVTKAQGSVSALVTKLDSTKAINESTIVSLTEDKSDLEDLDIISAATELSNAQNSLQMSYQIGSMVLQGVSLLDYI